MPTADAAPTILCADGSPLPPESRLAWNPWLAAGWRPSNCRWTDGMPWAVLSRMQQTIHCSGATDADVLAAVENGPPLIVCDPECDRRNPTDGGCCGHPNTCVAVMSPPAPGSAPPDDPFGDAGCRVPPVPDVREVDEKNSEMEES